MVLWRMLPLNLSRSNLEWLRARIHRSLNHTDTGVAFGAVGITVCRVRFITLPDSERRNVGFQLMLSFWAWGDTDDEVMANLARNMQNLRDALHAALREAHDFAGIREEGA